MFSVLVKGDFLNNASFTDSWRANHLLTSAPGRLFACRRQNRSACLSALDKSLCCRWGRHGALAPGVACIDCPSKRGFCIPNCRRNVGAWGNDPTNAAVVRIAGKVAAAASSSSCRRASLPARSSRDRHCGLAIDAHHPSTTDAGTCMASFGDARSAHRPRAGVRRFHTALTLSDHRTVTDNSQGQY